MIYYLNLEDFQKDFLFQEISDIKSFIKIKLKAIEFFMTFWGGNKHPIPPFLCIEDTNLHRMFLVNQDGNKIISWGFDFLVKTYQPNSSFTGNYVTHLNYRGKNGTVTFRNISEANTILNDYIGEIPNYYYLLNIDDNICIESIAFFEHLIFSEPSYIRYDNSMQGYKPLVHPQCHFDISFTPLFSYKFGLYNHIQLQDIQEVFKRNSKCLFIDLPDNKFFGKKKRNRIKHAKRRR